MDLNRSIREQARDNSRLKLLDDAIKKIDRLKEATKQIVELKWMVNRLVVDLEKKLPTALYPKDVKQLIDQALKLCQRE